MKLKVFGSNSKGNSYILYNETECLMIEAGVKFENIKRFLNFDISTIQGCLITHEHGDHCKYAKEVVNAGIEVYTQKETAEAFNFRSHRVNAIAPGQTFRTGNFTIMAFSVKHDVPCLGFLIHHKECGMTLFLTDTYYSEFTFKGLNNIIVEANYCENIIREKLSSAAFLKDRIYLSHLSIKNCCELLAANDISQVNNIVLIHLSDGNSNEKEFVDRVEKQTGKTVYAATKELEIEFNKTPF